MAGSAAAAAPHAAPCAASAAAPRPPAPADRKPPSPLVDSLLDNPLCRSASALLVVLLAGFGIYRCAQRAQKDSGETSFLESRLQPDSFFGASGGQRIDTRDAARQLRRR